MLSWDSSVGISCWAEQNSPLDSLKDLVEGSGRHGIHVPLCEYLCLSADLIHQPDPLPSAITGLPQESWVPNQKNICLGGRTHICFHTSNWGNKSFNFYEKSLDDT